MRSRNNVSGPHWANRFKLTAVCLAAFLPSSVLSAQAAPQLQDPASPASAQQSEQPTQSAPSQPAEPPANQPAQSQPARPVTRPVRHRITLDDQVKSLAKSLDLNESQQAAVKKILERRQVETLQLRQNSTISGADRIGRLRALQDQTVERIRSVLNDEQKKKYNPLAVRQTPSAPDQKSVEDWLKATSPH